MAELVPNEANPFNMPLPCANFMYFNMEDVPFLEVTMWGSYLCGPSAG